MTQFGDKLDTMFLIAEQMTENCGEDSFCCAYEENSAIVAVFDGCGGLGSRTYPGFQGHTGAYMASRLVSGAVYDWYKATHATRWGAPQAMLESLNRYLERAFVFGTSYGKSTLKLSGSMVRDFPTTAAIALAQQDTQGVLLHVIWAGDSRVYLMDADGLAQLTKDDVNVEDALENLYEDGALKNVLSSDGKYVLHYNCVRITRPAVVFAATDGCFGYLPSPMDFEYVILRALEAAGSEDEFKKYLKNSIQDVAGDDTALGLMSFFFETFGNLKSAFAGRLRHLEQQYIIPMQSNQDIAYIRSLWQTYRRSYERYL